MFGDPEEEAEEKEKVKVDYNYLHDDVEVQKMNIG